MAIARKNFQMHMEKRFAEATHSVGGYPQKYAGVPETQGEMSRWWREDGVAVAVEAKEIYCSSAMGWSHQLSRISSGRWTNAGGQEAACSGESLQIMRIAWTRHAPLVAETVAGPASYWRSTVVCRIEVTPVESRRLE